MMANAILKKMFQKILDNHTNCHLKIIDYFWNHWDELVEDQHKYVNRQDEYADIRYGIDMLHYDFKILPKELRRILCPKMMDDLNLMLWNHAAYKKDPDSNIDIKMTRIEFVEIYCESLHLDLFEGKD